MTFTEVNNGEFYFTCMNTSAPQNLNTTSNPAIRELFLYLAVHIPVKVFPYPSEMDFKKWN